MEILLREDRIFITYEDKDLEQEIIDCLREDNITYYRDDDNDFVIMLKDNPKRNINLNKLPCEY